MRIDREVGTPTVVVLAERFEPFLIASWCEPENACKTRSPT